MRRVLLKTRSSLFVVRLLDYVAREKVKCKLCPVMKLCLRQSLECIYYIFSIVVLRKIKSRCSSFLKKLLYIFP